MIDVSIIIVSWNTKDILRDCVTSIYAQTNCIDFEIIVVDNCSSDGTVKMLLNDFPEVIVIANKTNRGFAAANNQGMTIAKGQYYLLLNPDTLILDGAIQKTYAFAEKNRDIGVVGCQVWLDEKNIQQTCFSFPSISNLIIQKTGLRRVFHNSFIFGRVNYGWWDRKSQMDVDVVSGMYMLVRLEAVKQVGLMDESYFVYAEETDWCFRFRAAGWRCVFTPMARIVHLDGGNKSTDQASIKMFVQLQKSHLIFYRKQRGLVSWFIAKTIYTSTMFVNYCFFSLLYFLKRKNVFLKRVDQSRAALKFHLCCAEPE
jgi:hypothetical protein